MAFKICLKIGDIKGESGTAGHIGDIDVLSWNWGLTQSASAHIGTGGIASGSADVKDLTITKYVDKATPSLLQACFRGSNQKEAVLTVIKASGDSAIEFVKITMSGTVVVSSVKTGDPLPNDMYSETVTLNFANVKFEYKPQLADHTEGAVSTAEFDIPKGV
jgi:type VI secretion system secreted protein Hcp